MKQKRSKSELNEMSDKLQTQANTRSGGNLDQSEKVTGKNLDCASGVCVVTWKPDSIKR